MGAVLVYYKFFREGTHKQRIEFDIDFLDLGIYGNDRIVEIGVIAENKGNVEQSVDDIRLHLRGLIFEKNSHLSEIPGYEPRLKFPMDLGKYSIVAQKYRPFFVRPKVRQRFPVVLRIPTNLNVLHVRATFKYKGTKDIHSAERAFSIGEKL